MQKNGNFLQADFFDNTGGLNLSDSPFKVKDGQATDGSNYDYVLTGGIRKRKGHQKVNSSADGSLKSLGLALNNTASGTKTVIRAAGTAIQYADLSVPSFTALTEDTTAASSAFLTSGSTQPVIFSQFNTTSANILWAAGGGMDAIYGAYSTTKVTKNGVAVPTGSITATVSLTGGSFAATGDYRYAVAFRKTSTQAISNAVFSESATLANTTDKVTIDLTLITNIDTTKYDKFYIYRSAVSGASGFTTGDLVAQVAISATSYVDTGTSLTSSTNVPRADSLVLDNSVLATATYKVLTTFKRRLVTASNSTLYFSDVNKPESWPTVNTITVPSGGPITGLATISFTSASADTIDELLVIFKERELWVITGSSISDWSLKQIDNVGCPNQSLIVSANGFLSWIDYRGIYLWEGTGKPIYCSRPIEAIFDKDGDLDKPKLLYGFGQFYRKNNQIIWVLSHKIYGEQKFIIKMDVRLTLPNVENNLTGRIIDGVFIFDDIAFSVYAGLSYLPSTSSDESLLIGDDSGYVYQAYNVYADAGSGYDFFYTTKFLDFGNPNSDKRYNYVVVWVEEVGDWNLLLDYWTDYAVGDGLKSTRALPLSTADQNAAALWDVARWDIAFWDDYTTKLRPLWFQLASDANNNTEGKSIRLQFRQETANQPVTIAGFSVLFNEKGANK